MDFAALPPEVNSARMYTGPGAAPMMAAAAAWNGLGAELSTTAASYESVIATLTGEEWLGPASASMAAAAAPYVAWLNSTAAALEHAAIQAMASAAAYETAFAMTVPPPVIAANRATLAALVATNVLGQNTAAIAATEAHYGQMWAQDAVAMYGYAASSATAGVLRPLSAPPAAANPAGQAAQGAAVAQAASSSGQAGLSQLVSNLPGAVQGLASPLAGSDVLTDAINSTQNIGLWNAIQTYGSSITNVGAWNMFAGITAAAGLSSAHAAEVAATAPLAAGLVSSTTPVATGGFAGAPVLAGAGQAASVGGLSVPPSWSAATPAGTAPAALAGSGWAAPAEEGAAMTAVPAGMPAAAAGRGSFGFGTPRYGVKPTVMQRPVMVG